MEETVTVSIGSWNVGQTKPPDPQLLREWLQLHRQPTLVVVGLQEIDMSIPALLQEATAARKPWLAALQAAVGNAYACLGTRQLVGLLLAVFATKEASLCITGVAMQVVRCGKSGKLGNKGCIGLRLQMRKTTMVFINAHLAAHRWNLHKRTRDFERCMGSMTFPVPDDDPVTPDSHDVVFFFGDLNYRIELLQDEAIRLIEDKEWTKLLQVEQLTNELQRCAVLQGFRDTLVESVIFDPTYKYIPGTRSYDRSVKVKKSNQPEKRTPAWTDRILWRSHVDGRHRDMSGSVSLGSFGACDTLLQSDHRPVCAVFAVTVHGRVRSRSSLGGAAASAAIGANGMWESNVYDADGSVPSYDLEDIEAVKSML
eukprot:Sspe_Gene.94710::Locus_67056_Transcript_1_1_Confidence_1.000_Length_1869::g.94710::m.94710/K01099/INPP5B_F; inositol polyphosphate 5-phosphatase INPP5B/F